MAGRRRDCLSWFAQALPSQFYEGSASRGPPLVPSDEPGKAQRTNEVREQFKRPSAEDIKKLFPFF